MICPICNAEFSDDLEICPVCGRSASKNERLYQTAMNLMNRCHTALGYRGIAAVFDEISDYQDAQEKAEECLARTSQLANTVDAAEVKTSPVESPSETRRRSRKTASIVGVVICMALLLSIAATIGNTYRMKKVLVREWYALDDSIIKVLDIRDEEIEYRLETGISWLDTTVATFDWKPGFGNKIKVKLVGDYSTYRIKLNNEGTILTVYPAITSPDSYETWYYIDD